MIFINLFQSKTRERERLGILRGGVFNNEEHFIIISSNYSLTNLLIS